MESQEKFSTVIKTRRLPTLPEVAQRLVDLAKQADPDTAEVCRVIKSDPATCCKILKTVNSVLFAFRPRIETIEQAVPKLGMSLIRTLILNFHFASITSSKAQNNAIAQEHWKCSIIQAVIAELLAESSGKDQHFFFMAGMLQDIGILAMLNEFPEEYCEVVKHSSFPDVVAAERENFGFSHVEVSCAILKRWNIGDGLSKLIRGHHRLVNVGGTAGYVKGELIMQAANWGAELISQRKSLAGSDDNFSQWFEFLTSQFKLDLETAGNFLVEVEDRVNEISATYGFDIGKPLCTQSLVSKAKEILHEIAFNNHLGLIGKSRTDTNKKPEDNELYIDCLTGLFNRRYLNDVLGAKIEQWLELNQQVAIMFLDADRFKSINDEYGHSAGDEAILHIGRWLEKNVRNLDYVVRLGGDEFLIVLQTDFETVSQIATRIIDDVPTMRLMDGTTLPLSLSAGCAVSQEQVGKLIDVNELIDCADQLMYRAKQIGGSTCCIELIESASKSMLGNILGMVSSKLGG